VACVPGGLIVSIVLGFIGALLGPWVAGLLELSEPFTISPVDSDVVWLAIEERAIRGAEPAQGTGTAAIPPRAGLCDPAQPHRVWPETATDPGRHRGWWWLQEQ